MYATWNFTEAGHGKGAPDGVGGLLKRTADRLVAHGRDITNADDFVKEVSSQVSIRIYMINGVDISSIENTIPANLRPVSGTMLVHQVLSKKA